MQRQISRLKRGKAALILIDIQERLLPAIFENQRLIENAVRLIRGATILGLPVLATEQYPQGLGPTVPGVKQALGAVAAVPKVTFSSCGAEGYAKAQGKISGVRVPGQCNLLEALKCTKVSGVILCGMESHVCVVQTCLDLLEAGFTVFVPADAVSSRTAENWRIGLERMRDAGAAIVSVEMVLFELLERAGTEEFKKVLELVK